MWSTKANMLKNRVVYLCSFFLFARLVSAAFAMSDTVVEKHDKTFELKSDGTYSQENEVLIRLISERGAKNSGQVPLSYSESLQSLEVLEAYTVRPDGTRIIVTKDKIFEQAAPVAVSAPQFNDLKYKIIVFPEPLVGGKIYFRVSIKQHISPFPNQVSIIEVIPDTVATESLVVRVSAPLELALKTDARGVVGGKMANKNGRAHWEWRFRNTTARRAESFEVSSTDFGPFIAFSSFQSWGELAKAYLDRAAPKAAVTPEITALATDLTKGISDPKLQAQAIHNWVTRNIRYVGVFLGLGGFVPRDGADVLKSKYGDCKDHSVLLEALLRAKGIESTPALINTGDSYLLPSIPIASAFNHVITYVPAFNVFMDSTASFSRYGNLPSIDAGKPVLLASSGRLSQTPNNTATTDTAKDTIRLTLDSSGDVSGKTLVEVTGSMETGLRSWVAAMPASDKDRLVARWFGAKFKAEGNHESSDPNDLSTPFVFSATYTIKNAVNLDSPGAFVIPVGLTYSTIHNLVAIGATTATIRDTHFICGSDSRSQDIVLTLPESISIVSLPKNVMHRTKTITYEANYKQEGRSILVKRKLIRDRAKATCEPAQWEEIIKTQDVVARDAKAQVLFR